jgi:hypothetical protein
LVMIFFSCHWSSYRLGLLIEYTGTAVR